MMTPYRLYPVIGVLVAFQLAGTVIYASALHQTDVFVSGQDGYNTFRIPAIVQAANGRLLAFAEGRKNSSSDTGDIDLVMKYSNDGGYSWSSLQVVGDNGPNTFGNPAPLVDQSTGRVYLVTTHNLGQDSQSEISAGTSDGTRTVWIQHSDNHGLTWSNPTEITSMVKPESWRWYATTPGHAIQLERGDKAGRLVVPFNYGQPSNNGAGVIYSDDNGATWQTGGIVLAPTNGAMPSESSAVELTNAQVYLNSRNRASSQPGRAQAYGILGGEYFINIGQAEELIDPVVQGSTVRYAAIDRGDAQNRILFSNPADPSERRHMTIKSSFDETQSWNDGKLVYRGRSAYSDLVKINDAAGGGGLLFEKGITASYQRITFVRYDTEWLDDPSFMYMDFSNQLAKDKRGNGMDGVIEGSPVFVQGDPRYGGGTAIRFDGVDDIVRIDDETDGIFDFEAENSFTLEVVFRTTDHNSGGASGSGPLISKDVGANSPSYWLRIQDGKTRFLVDDGSGSASVTSNTDVTDGLWHHLAAVRDAVNHELRLYLDYELVGTIADPTDGDFGNTNDLLLGAFNASTPGSKRFIGDIDLARVSFGALGTDEFVQPDLIAGDLDGDGFVGIADLNIVLGNWNQNVGAGNPLLGDPSGDGFVGIEDLNTVLGNWNAGTSPGADSVPEPGAALVLTPLAGLWLSKRKR